MQPLNFKILLLPLHSDIYILEENYIFLMKF